MPAYLNAIYNLEGTIKEFWKNLNCNCRQKENLEANPLIAKIDLLEEFLTPNLYVQKYSGLR